MSTSPSNTPFHEDAIQISSIVLWKIGDASKTSLQEKNESLLVGFRDLQHNHPTRLLLRLFDEEREKVTPKSLPPIDQGYGNAIEVGYQESFRRTYCSSNIPNKARITRGYKQNGLSKPKISMKV